MTSLISTDSRVRYLCISDIHLGHDRNPTKNIVQNLRRFFDDYSSKSIFAHLDVIFIVGDLFDQLIDCSGSSVYDALEFITSLVNFCERNKIKLRVLEGTPSHDRQQNRLFEAVLNFRSTKADVKWVKTLCIEKMEDLDLSILYIPDEWTSSAETTQALVQDLLQEEGLDQVDIAMMHGVFGYQMANIPGKHDTHNEDYYLNIVRHFINIGHHHNFSNYERIVAQGSTDRLAHGEEGPKGGCLMTIRDNGTDYFEFIENRNAMIFKTIELIDHDVDRSLRQLEHVLKKLPDESHVRIKAPKLHPAFAVYSDLKKQYPFLHFSKLSNEEEEEQQKSVQATIEASYSVVEIRPENVVDMIMEEVKSRSNQQFHGDKHLRRLLEDLQA